MAFGFGFLAAYLACTEFNTGSASESSAILFKRNLKAALHLSGTSARKAQDEEKLAQEQEQGSSTQEDASSALVQSGVGKPAVTDTRDMSMSDVFSWQHIGYTVPISGGRHKRLLDDISGYVAPGKLTALMGATGAGKVRQLIDLLKFYTLTCGRPDDTLERLGGKDASGCCYWGSIRQRAPSACRFPSSDVSLKHVLRAYSTDSLSSGYCQQLDTHVPSMTVREALLFSAKLRQPKSVPDSEKEA